MTKRERIALGALVLVALATRFYRLGWGLPDFYEEAYPFRVAWSMWGWESGRGLDLHPHFFKYPSLVIYLQMLGQGVLQVVLGATGAIRSSLDFRAMAALDPTPHVLTARSITALFGALTTIPVYFLGRRCGGSRVGAIAALLVALCPALISKSQVVEVDVPLTFFVAVVLLAALSLQERPLPARALVAGALVGLAASAKYPGALLLIPCAVALALAKTPRGARKPPRAPEKTRSARRKDKPGGRAERAAGAPLLRSRFGLAALLLASAGAAFLATSPYVLVDVPAFLADFLAEREHMALGHFGLTKTAAWREYLGVWFGSLFGWTFGIASVAGLGYFAWRREPWAWIVGGFVVVYFAIVGSWTMKADRYLLPLVPPCAVFAAALAARAADVAPRWMARSALVWLTIALLVPFVPLFREHVQRWKPDPRTAAREWIHRNVPAGALVASEAYGPQLRGPMWLRTLDPGLRAVILERPTPLYATLELPFFQVSPERITPLYDSSLFRDVDVLVVSAAVRERYEADSAQFAVQCAFYDSLEARFVRRAHFVPEGSSGSAVTVYGNPAALIPYALRSDIPPAEPASGGRNLAVGFFHFNRGVNAESFGFLERAVESYRLAVRQGELGPEDAALSRARIGRCLVRMGVERATAYLDSAAVGAPDPLERETLASLVAPMRQQPMALAVDSIPDLRRHVARR